MAASKLSDDNHILSTAVKWEVKDILGMETNSWNYFRISQSYRFLSDRIFNLKVIFSCYYWFLIEFKEGFETRTIVSCEFSFINRSEHIVFHVCKELTFEKGQEKSTISVLDKKDLEEFVVESTLTIQCKLSAVRCPESKDCSTQTDALLLPGNVKNAVAKASQTENSCASGIPTKYLEKLSADFETIFKDQADADCILKTTGGKISAHRAVLSARSKVFAAMFHHETEERRTGEVNIEDVEGTILHDLVHYIYTGNVVGLTPETAVRLYTAADKYDLHELREASVNFLSCNLTTENVCDATRLARNHAEKGLESRIVRFIVDNFDKVTEGVD